MNYSLFKIIVKPSRKVQFSSEKQKDMSDDGIDVELSGRLKINTNQY